MRVQNRRSTVNGAAVSGTIIEHTKGDKVIVFKKKEKAIKLKTALTVLYKSKIDNCVIRKLKNSNKMAHKKGVGSSKR